jgi:D-tyrosyl-tRNA(Tyr) deacylase
MISVVQRVTRAEVRVDGECVGRIGEGLMALVAIMDGDAAADVQYMADRLLNMRIFPDQGGRMNLPVTETGGGILLVSNFTVGGDTRRGRRPSFSRAAPPPRAKELFDDLVSHLRAAVEPVETGVFAAMMEVDLVNDGPVTLIIDSRETRRGGRHERKS